MPERSCRVLCVLPGLSADGGTEQSFAATAELLVDLGVDLHVAVLTRRQGLAAAVERAGVVVHDMSAVPTATLLRASALRSLVRRIDADLIHASLHDATLPAQLAAIVSRRPVLVSWVNVSYGPSRRGEPGVSPLRLEVLRWEETVLGRLSRSWYQAVTPEVGRLTAASLHVPPGRVLLGERGRDPELFPFRTQRQPVPADIPVPPGAELVVAVGRQEPQKGYERLLGAFDRLARRRPDVHLVVAGRSGSATEDLERRRAALASGDRVHLVGQYDDVPGLLAAADVVVCTSRREGAAGALVEAMAVGAPVVSLPVPGLDGVLVHGRNSLVVPEEELDLAVESVWTEPNAAESRALVARREFEARFTHEAAATQLFEIYRTALGRRR